ncbi:MAG: carbamoyltransferase C-terminal domain-containing protein [Acidobacteriota bacterium]
MRILGIHDGHNAAASLLEDGAIRVAIQEERLTREKNFAGFPRRAIEAILEESGLKLDDIDRFAVVGREMPDQNTKASRLALYREVGRPGFLERQKQVQRRQDLYDTAVPPRLRRTIKHALGREITTTGEGRLAQALAFGLPEERIEVVEHHRAHAASAYYGLGNYDRDILVLTNDGEGDELCATVSIGRAGRLRRIGAVPRTESIGNLYAVVTFLLGMVPLEHEYKLMGMAPYADEKRVAEVCAKLKRLFTFQGAPVYGWKRAEGTPDLFYSYSLLRELFEFDRFDSICGGLQRFTEEMLLQWVRNSIAATGIRHLALSGGVFMNVKLNKAIMELPEVDDLFVFPSCGDETNIFGASWLVAADKFGHEKIAPLREFYFGKSFDDRAVKSAIESYRFRVEVNSTLEDDIETRVAELLTKGEIVARFCDREEFGARALGNRSILADPSNNDVVKIINSMIKSRDFWMPFATSMTDKQASRCLVNPKGIRSPYMILTFDTTDCISDLKAGAHPYDLTVRPQVVEREWNPRYYRLIEEFERLSGKRGGVLNTSFNLHGHPLVSSPRDALDVFDRSGLKHVAIENYLISKR